VVLLGVLSPDEARVLPIVRSAADIHAKIDELTRLLERHRVLTTWRPSS